MFLRSPARSLLLLLALVSLPHLAVAQASECGPGDLEVVQVSFAGNHAFGDDSLGRAIATTPSSWMRRVVGLPLGRKRCLDNLELQRDVIRLRLFYRQRGYYKTQVTTSQEMRATSRVAVHFQIDEGPPVITDSLTVTGLDTVRNGERLLRFILPFKDHVYNRLRLQQAIDTVVDRLRNTGYAQADEPLRNTFVDTTTDRATVELTFLPGRIYHIGAIDVHIQPAAGDSEPDISPSTVRRLLSVKQGDVYRQRNLLTSQRDLYQLETYGHVDLGVVPDSSPGSGDSLLTVVAELSEAKMRSIRLGLGWATLDCFRMQSRYVDRNFLGGARRLELNASVSKIGVGAPLDGFPGLCTTKLRNDQFSEKLNYSLSATFRPPALFGTRNVPSLTLYSERRSEYNAFLRYTPIGGLASITREIARRTPLTLAYLMEYGRTQADEAIFCQVFNVCNLQDIARLQSYSNLRVASVSLARDRSDNAFNPTTGSQMRAEFRTGTTSADTANVRFNKVSGEVSVYHPVGGSSVLAARLQLGAVLDGWSLN
ncbi:MAG TPA: POTRA domain-containing protein, partial [Gemmatimonadaceae bacterium]|nr:POTRA domain-containing protein [Gemmatimonadaceae bacterium]